MSSAEDIDPDGDLTLIVGLNEIKRFKVSRVALRLASPVWKAMFCGTFSEASAKEVRLRDDDAGSMGILLLIAHLQFERLPHTLPLADLANVAMLSDKYQCGHMSRNRMMWWMVEHQDKPIVTRGFAIDWMWLAWTYRRSDWFLKAVTYVLDEMAPVDIAGMTQFPPGCHDFLMQRNEERFQKVRKLIYEAIEKYKQRKTRCHFTTPSLTEPTCESRRIGQLAMALRELSIPFTTSKHVKVSSFQFSTSTLSTVLQPLNNVIENAHRGHASGAHGICLQGMTAFAKFVVELRGKGHDKWSDEIHAHFKKAGT